MDKNGASNGQDAKPSSADSVTATASSTTTATATASNNSGSKGPSPRKRRKVNHGMSNGASDVCIRLCIPCIP